MYILPDNNIYKNYIKGCCEKVYSYCMLSSMNLPVLKSIILTYDELGTIGKKEEDKIKKYLQSDVCMIRYLYKKPCNVIRNGGKSVKILKEALLDEMEENADFWLLEPSSREENIFCCNICVNHALGNLHIEIMGRGFDISDLNKGKVSPHEIIDISYPICYGAYGEWWKWAYFRFCTQNEYEQSVFLRKQRLKEFQSEQEIEFGSEYKPIDLNSFKSIFSYLQKVENSRVYQKEYFYNLSCSYTKNGRFVFWDIQTPKGKLGAYF